MKSPIVQLVTTGVGGQGVGGRATTAQEEEETYRKPWQLHCQHFGCSSISSGSTENGKASQVSSQISLTKSVESIEISSSAQLSNAATPSVYIVVVEDGVAHCHSKGIIHRDVKPANLLLNSVGVLKIVVFGLARLTIWSLYSQGTLTRTSLFLIPFDNNRAEYSKEESPLTRQLALME